jgi:hypothetical protein
MVFSFRIFSDRYYRYSDSSSTNTTVCDSTSTCSIEEPRCLNQKQYVLKFNSVKNITLLEFVYFDCVAEAKLCL